MDELEILKRDWKKNENSFNQITEKEIYGMLHKKSSSIVKWILVISILEILLWVILGVFSVDESYLKTLETYHLKTIMPIISALNYAVILFFIYLFYKQLKNQEELNKNETQTDFDLGSPDFFITNFIFCIIHNRNHGYIRDDP